MTNCKIITSVERKRRWSAEEKRQIVEETYVSGFSVSQVARKYGMNPSQLFVWRRLMEKGALQGLESQDDLVPKSQLIELEKRIRELERVLGKKTLENEILKEAVRIGREKKLISRQPLPEVADSVLGG
jgi:transposase